MSQLEDVSSFISTERHASMHHFPPGLYKYRRRSQSSTDLQRIFSRLYSAMHRVDLHWRGRPNHQHRFGTPCTHLQILYSTLCPAANAELRGKKHGRSKHLLEEHPLKSCRQSGSTGCMLTVLSRSQSGSTDCSAEPSHWCSIASAPFQVRQQGACVCHDNPAAGGGTVHTSHRRHLKEAGVSTPTCQRLPSC